MEKLLAILSEIAPDVDAATCETLVTDHLLDSLAILSLVAELEDAYDIRIPAVEIVPANFNSAHAILAMVNRLEEA